MSREYKYQELYVQNKPPNNHMFQWIPRDGLWPADLREARHSTCSVSCGQKSERGISSHWQVYLGVTSSRCSRCPGSGRAPVFEAVPVYTKCTRTIGGSLLDRLSVNSEPIETCVLRMAPVWENPKLHYLESSVRFFQNMEHLEWFPFLIIHKLSQKLPFLLVFIF